MKKYRSFLCVLLLLCAFIVPINIGNYELESVVYADEVNSSKLENLTISGFENNLNPTFNSEVTSYNLSITSNIIDLEVLASPIDSEATVEITGNKYMKNSTGQIKIKVTDSLNTNSTTYTINYSKNLDEDLSNQTYTFLKTGDYQTFTTTMTGMYKIELWGAQGGHLRNTYNNGGAYTAGEIMLPAGTNLYVFVGEAGHNSNNNPTYNGGGAGGTALVDNLGFSGGGATDIRLYVDEDGNPYNIESLKSRIMVAGGGGGAAGSSNYDTAGGKSAAGGLTSYTGGYYAGHDYVYQNGGAATQTAGGVGGVNHYSAEGINESGTFGKGGTSYSISGTRGAGGGGGGYFGGGAGGGTGESGYGQGGAGGSSFISGHTGSVAILDSEEITPRLDSAGNPCITGTSDITCSYHYTGYKFANTTMIDGQGYAWTNIKGSLEGMPKPDGTGTFNGNREDGYARIAMLALPSDDNYLTSITSSEGTFDKTFDPLTDTYYLELSSYTAKFTLSGTTSDNYASVAGFNEYRLNLGETKRINIIVTSASGNQRTYKVIATRSESELTTSSTKLKSLTIDNGNYTIDFEPLVYTYNVDISKSAMELDINAITFDSGASVNIIDNEYLTNTTGRVKIVVSKEGLEDTIYRINYNKVLEDTELADAKEIYTYTGTYDTFITPVAGKYKVELWGGAGSFDAYGAYTSGIISLAKNETLYIYVGNRATGTKNTTVFNAGTSDSDGFNGGGATDIRLVSGPWNDFESLKSRIMVAAGGGAGIGDESKPGAAGGLEGYDGAGSGAGSQTSTPIGSYTPSTFGVANGGCTGGNGYFPGDGSDCATGAGGGSSYISGHDGAIAISESSTSDLIIPTASSIHYSGKYFTDTVMVDGKGYNWTTEKTTKTGMPSFDGTTIYGNNSEGRAVITPVYISNDAYLTSITSNIGEFNTTFNPTTFEYNLIIDKYEQKVTLYADSSDKDAVITGLGEYTLSSGETKKATITVTAPSGKTKTYTVNITRATLAEGEHNSKLVNLSIDGYRFDIPFTSLTYIYNIDMSKNVYDVVVNAIPYDNTATITITGNRYMDSDYNVINIKVSSEGVEDTIYKVYYTKLDYNDIYDDYGYTGDYETFVAPYDGNYLFQLWGASGSGTYGGNGGYTAGKMSLAKGDTFYIYVGEHNTNTLEDTFNASYKSTNPNYNSGGGATDVRLTSGNWDDLTSLKSRIMVAAGGGGYGSGRGTSTNYIAGAAGGLTGYNAAVASSETTAISYGSTQLSGGTPGVWSPNPSGVRGTFGIGATGVAAEQSNYRVGAGGGGGYYGGSAGPDCSGNCSFSGSGGSSYISGHAGAIAIKSESDLSPRDNSLGVTCGTGTTDIVCSYHYSGYKFIDTVMVDGNGYNWTTVKGTKTNMPNYTGTDMITGNTGNGHAKISIIDVLSQNAYLDDLRIKKYDYTDDYLIDFGFDPLVNEYNITLDKYTRAFEISGDVSDSKAKVTGYGKYTIEPGESKTIDVTVTAVDGNSNTYRINVTRETFGNGEHTALLKNLQIDKYNLNESFYSKKYDYTVNIFDVEIDLVVNAIPFDDETVITVSGNRYISNDTGVITVTAKHLGLSDEVYTIRYTKIVPTMDDVTFNYTGEYTKWTAPLSAKYKLEVWGASGGGNAVTAHTTSSSGGLGGYAAATFKILENTDLYIYAGGKGTYGAGSNSYGGPLGGWNGGGSGGISTSGSGGGATDIRMTPTSEKTIWNEENSLYSRIIVAGGAGGADDGGGTLNGSNDGSGGSGDGLIGQGAWYNGAYQVSYAGTQVSGNALGAGADVTVKTDTGGAGGGYYGGLVTNYGHGGGGAGSSYIKNYPGADTTYLEYQNGAIYVDKTGEFKAAQNNGNGYAKITFQGIISDNVYLSDLTLTTDLESESLIEENFDPLSNTYTAYIDKYTELFYVNGVLSDDSSTVTGLGEYRITNPGDSMEINVEVTAESSKTKTYTIKVYRDAFEEGEHSTKLSSLHEATYNLRENFYSEKYDYRINVYGNEIDTNWTYTTYDPEAVVTVTGDKYIKTGFGTITFTVSLPSEYNVADTVYEVVYTKVVTEEASKNNYLSSLTSSAGTLSPDFDILETNYTIHLSSTETGTRLTGVLDDAKALATGLDKFYNVEAGSVRTVEVVVTSDYGTTRTYRIDISRDNYDSSIPSTKLKSLTIDGYDTDIDFQSDIYSYDIVIPKGEIDLTIIGVPYDDDAVVTVEDSKHLVSNTGTITVTVTKDGAEDTVYQINYTKYDNYDVGFDYTGDYQTFTAPYTGKYTFELWGAGAGTSMQTGKLTNTASRPGGAGGYTKGSITLQKGDTFYIYVGGRGQDAIIGDALGGYNGGGNATYDHSDDESAGAGGGATDIRLVPGVWNYNKSLASRIMVAGGGGGAAYNQAGGYAGGLVGEAAHYGEAASQTSGYAFGYGENGIWKDVNVEVAGGGGGYYGGFAKSSGAKDVYQASGGGGSSYISGHTGSVAITSISDLTPRTDSLNEVCTNGTTDITCSYHYSGYKFTDTLMIPGNQTMPTHDGASDQIGNSGNGYAKVSMELSQDAYLNDLSSDYGVWSDEFDPLQFDYTIRLNQYEAYLNLDGVLSNPNATVTNIGRMYEVELGGTSIVPINVTAPNGDTLTYTVTIVRDNYTDTHSSKLSLLNVINYEEGYLTPKFTPIENNYTISVDSSEAEIHVDYIPYDSEATVTVTGDGRIIGENGVITVRVSAPDVEDTIYTISYVLESIPEGSVYDLDYTGSYQAFAVPTTGIYKLEVWGAQGGGRNATYTNTNMGIGGLGGYSTGKIKLYKDQILYVYVGGTGTPADEGIALGGFNGGGTSMATNNTEPAAGGGGATDIRTNVNDIYTRFIVAGGGGGGGEDAEAGGIGGGTTGGNGGSSCAGTQTAGTCGAIFGSGASTAYDGGGGGGGWYGGGTAGGSQNIPTENNGTDTNGGSGGSGFVLTGATVSNTPTGYKLGSEWYLEDAKTVSGNAVMPTIDHKTIMYGKSGNGYASITLLEKVSRNNYLVNLSSDYGILSPSFNSDIQEYTLSLDAYSPRFNLTAIASDSGATIVNTGDYNIEPGETKTINVIVTSSSGDIRTYKVVATRDEFSDEHSSLLSSLSIDSGAKTKLTPGFNSKVYEYNISLYHNFTDLDIEALAYDEDAIVTITGNKHLANTGTIIITVNCPNVGETTYKINYTKDKTLENYETFADDVVYTYDYTGKYETFIAPINGEYIFELWGASGNSANNGRATGGAGGYTYGILSLAKDEKLYIYVGQNRTDRTASWNAGTTGGSSSNTTNGGGANGYGGGGATDVRTVPTSSLTTWNELASLKSRIMVAGGGGGISNYSYPADGGAAGGLVGYSGNNGKFPNQGVANIPPTGGTQTSGGMTTQKTTATIYAGSAGGFGTGGNGHSSWGGAGGGGYYNGGGAGYSDSSVDSGAGGSSFISGHLGSVAIASDAALTPRTDLSGALCSDGTTDITCSYHYSGKIFTNTKMLSGIDIIPSKTGSGETTGNIGNGYARITQILKDRDNYLETLTSTYGTFDKVFDPLVNEYTLTLDQYDTSFTIEGTLSNNDAIVTGFGYYEIEPGETKEITISVTSESGDTKDYIITAIRNNYSDEHSTKLKELRLLNNESIYGRYGILEEFNSLRYSYTASLYANVIDLTINAIPYDSEAKVEFIGNKYLNSETGDIVIRVYIPNSTVEDTFYTITYNKEIATNVEDEYNYAYTGKYNTFVAPYTGSYKLEAWGAQGGNAVGNNSSACSYGRGNAYGGGGCGGFGAYTAGEIFLNRDDTLYIYVGARGANGRAHNTVAGGWNGGGSGQYDHSDDEASGAGGGATDFRFIHTAALTTWNEFNSLKSRIMVAAGGGGGSDIYAGGNGGTTSSVKNRYSANATQTTGNAFGYGENAVYRYSNIDVAGGGGGYMGGRSTGNSNYGQTGTGGSSYVSGCNGCVAIDNESKSQSNLKWLDTPIHYSGYKFENIVMLQGSSVMPSPTTGAANAVGRVGNGYAKITPLFYSRDYYLTSLTATTMHDNNMFPAFDPLTDTYSITMDKYDEWITLDAELSDPINSVITGLGEYRLENPGDNLTVPLVITSQSGEQKIYTIHIHRNDFEIHTTKLKDLDIIGSEDTIDPRFNSLIYEYDIPLSAGVIDVALSAIPYDDNAVIEYATEESSNKLNGNEIYYLKDDYGTIIITVSLPDEMVDENIPDTLPTTYIIRYDKNGSYNGGITYNGSYTKWVAPTTGYYLFEAWGASGGYDRVDNKVTHRGGLGAYTAGKLYVEHGDTFYIYVGGAGANGVKSGYAAGGYNGGGRGDYDHADDDGAGGGGGATDFRTYISSDAAWNNFDSLKSRIMVAAGGAGKPAWYGTGAAGGLSSISTTSAGAEATQTSGYAFGYGAPGTHRATNVEEGGGGGGYYGGGITSGAANRHAGGSSFISGHNGADAISEESTSTNIIHTGQPNHYSGYVFTDTVMIDGYGYNWSNVREGYVGMPNNAGTGIQTGQAGNGYAKITSLDQDNYLLSISVKIDKKFKITDGDNVIWDNVDGAIYTPEFNKFVNTYYLELPDHVTELTLGAHASSDNSKIEGLGLQEVHAGENVYEIKVIAESGEEKIYKLIVTRPSSEESRALQIDVTGFVETLCKPYEKDGYCKISPATYDPNNTDYYVTVPSGIRDLEWTVTKMHEYQDVIGSGVTRLGPWLNMVTIEVESELCADYKRNGMTEEYEACDKVTDYTYHVTRDMTGDNYIDELEVINPSVDINFDYLLTEYTFKVPNEYTELELRVKLDDPNATYEIVGNENFEVGANIVEIVVTAANGDVRTYVLNVYRLANGNKLLSELHVKNGTTEYTLNPPFEDITTSYTLDVPNEISSLNITATASYNKTTVSGTGNYNLNTGLNQIHVITTAENGETETYTVVVNRAKSNNAYLANLRALEGNFNETFVKTNNNYTMTVDPHIKKLNINAITEEEHATIKITGNDNFKIGNNVIKIVVTAENGKTNTYQITVNKLGSDVNTLATLTTNRGDVVPAFSPNTSTYNITVGNDITDIIISGTVTDNLSKVVGFGTYKLATGDNVIEITVTSETGISKVYTVNVFREYNGNYYLRSLNVSNGTITPTFDRETTHYTVNVANEVDSITITGVPEVNTTSVDGNGKYSLIVGENTFIIRATAENSAHLMYTITVVRDKSSNTNLSNLLIKEAKIKPTFNPMITSYTARVLYDIENINVVATPVDPLATVEITGTNNLVVGDNTVEVTVTADDGTEKVYEIVVTRLTEEESPDLLLDSLTISNCEINFDSHTYSYDCAVPNEITEATIEATAKEDDDNVFGTGIFDLVTGDNYFQISVTDGEFERVYTIYINRLKSTESRLDNIIINDHELDVAFSPDNFEYYVQTSEYELELSFIKKHPNQTIEVIGNDNMSVGSNDIRIVVTSEDGEHESTYILHVERLIRDNNYLSDLMVENYEISPEFTKEITTYKVSVPYEETGVIINAIAEDRNATIEGAGLKTLIPGPNTANIRVRAEDGSTREYRIIITRALSPNNYLESLTIEGEVYTPEFNKERLNYTLAVPYETDTINVFGVAEDIDATVIGNGEVSLKQGVNNVEVYVVAPDGSVRTYVIKVTRKDPITAKLLNIEVENYTLDPVFAPDLDTYQVTVDYETTKLNFIITKMDPYSTYEIVGNRNFKIGINDIYINVTSSNRIDTFQYHVIVNRQSYSNTFLSSLTVNQGSLTPDFNKSILTYTVEVENGIEYIEIDGSPDYPLSTVTGFGDYKLKVGTNQIPIVVTSPSGIKRTYIVIVNRKRSSNANLASITANIGTLTKDDDYTYTLVVPKYTNNIGRANFKVTTEDPTATVSMPVTIDLTRTKAYPIKVTSPDGTRTKEYTVNVVFDLSHDNTLAILTPSVGELSPAFNPKVNNYRIDLFDDETEEYFDLYLNEVEATLLNRSLTYQLVDLETEALISVQAEDGVINTYRVLIAKSKTKEKYVDNIVVTGIDPELDVAIPSFRSRTFEYEFEVPNEVESIGFEVTKRHPAQTIKVYKNGLLQTGNSYSLDVGINTLDVEISNTLGEKTIYTYKVTRKVSTNANLKSLGLTNPSMTFVGFDKDLLEYDAIVPYENESIEVRAIPENEGARITVNGATNLLEGEERAVTVKVTAADGRTTKTYTINVLREPLYNNLLKALTLSSGSIHELTPKFRPGNTNYRLTVSSTTASLQVDAIPFEDYTTVSGDIGTIPLEFGNNKLTITSTATVESGTYPKTYTINVFRPSLNDALLENIKVLNGTMVEPFVKTNDQYTVNVENDVTSLNLKVLTEDSNATYTITGNSNLGYGEENLVTIKVTAADGLTSKSYFLHVNVKGEANAYLSNLTVDGDTVPNFNKYIEEYNIKVENAIQSIEIEGIPESANSTITSGNGRHPLDVGENTIDIVVTAQDGETSKTYTINVTRDENAYLNYLATDQTGPIPGFVKTTYDYELTVSNDIDELTILGMAEDFENATVTGNGKYSLAVGDNIIYIAVRNGNTRKVYTVNVNRKGSANTNLLYLTSSDGELDPLFDNSIDDYEMHLPNYKTKLALAYEVEHNATVTILNNDLVAPESTVTLLVTAEDGTQRTINIKVYLEDGGYFNSRLANLEVTEGTISPKFDPDTYDYTLTVNQDVTTAHIVATPEESTSTISGDGPFDLELGRNKTSVVVTALDGTTTTYNLIIFRKDMDNADLTGLYTDIGELDPEFSPKIYNYTIKVPEETRKVHLTAVAYSEKTIVGDGDVYLQKGITTRNITVTSESGVVNTYVVNIDRALSTNHDITNITESTGEMPTYNPSLLEYNYKVGDVKTNLDKNYVAASHIVFDVTTYSELAEVIYEKEVIDGENTTRITLPSNDVSLDYGDNKFIIYAMSEDGNTSDEYVFNIYRIHDLTNITVPGDATGPAMLDGSPNHISVQPGGTFDLLSEITYTPEDADFKDLIFKSNNTSFVTIDANGIITAADVLDKSTTITVTSKYYPNIVKTVNVTVEITLISSDVYTIEREKDGYEPYINYIELKTSLDDFLNNLDNDRRFLHVYDLDGNEITDYSVNAGTGFKVTLENNGHTYDYLYLVVYGDINGDGYSNTTDLNSIKDHILRKTVLTGIKFLASDISEDGYTNTTDLNLVKNYILRKITSFFE